MSKQIKIAAGEFKAKCLQLMDAVQEKKSEVLITKRGKAVARLTSVEEPVVNLFGSLAGTITYHGDILKPLPLEDWEVYGQSEVSS